MSKYHPSNPNRSKKSILGLYLLPKGLGLTLALELFWLWPDLATLYGHNALLDSVLIQAQEEPLGFSIHRLIQYLPHVKIGPWETIHLFGAVYISLSVLLFLSKRTTLPALGLLLLHHCFFIGNYTWSYGVDYLAQTGLFFSVLFGGTSVTKLKRRKWSLWGFTLFRLQLTVVYFFAGLGKAYGAAWWNGEAIWKAVQQPFGGTYLQIPLTAYRFEWLWILLGILTLLIELSYPLVWFKKSSRPFVINGIILMHVGIALYMGLWYFAILMIWYNLCAWKPPFIAYSQANYKTS
ncbi:hypothetical protein ACFX5U_20360 [Sphingobacterium sp. SG20118]|uniref:hypothetical protein n=1 Tax=Sphingobacterium sp. SG20118 TaxID=3367156 RepID=UPI0037DFC0AE